MSQQKAPKKLIAITLVFMVLSGCGAPAPKPNATLVGTISMEERASSAQITLKVSNDGKTIESVGVGFTQLKCEGFSSGSSSTLVSANAAITNGKFVFKSTDFGEIDGQFTSPIAAKGSVHLAFFDGKAECGSWKWSAKGK
jgi:hypothetical protein